MIIVFPAILCSIKVKKLQSKTITGSLARVVSIVGMSQSVLLKRWSTLSECHRNKRNDPGPNQKKQGGQYRRNNAG
jgi:hypothetical protein